jgi:hypothetical protein
MITGGPVHPEGCTGSWSGTGDDGGLPVHDRVRAAGIEMGVPRGVRWCPLTGRAPAPARPAPGYRPARIGRPASTPVRLRAGTGVTVRWRG